MLYAAPVALVVLSIDQLTKWWATEELSAGRTIDLFWTLRFNLVHNEGAAFSLGTGFTPLIALGAICIAIAVIALSRRVERPPLLLILGLVLGGALGNVVDRFFRSGDGFLQGAVIDFIDFQWWPVFNVADIAVVVGGILAVLVARDEDLRRAGFS